MKTRSLWMFMVLAPIIAGCAIGYTRIAKAPDGPLRNYKTLQIPDLAGNDQIPQEVRTEISNKVAEELRKQKLFSEIDRGSSSGTESVIVMNGRVIQYNPGNRGMRYLTGPLWGVGKGSIIVNVKFVDKGSGKELADSNFEGEIKGGFFGGGIDETHDKIAEEIVQFIRSNY